MAVDIVNRGRRMIKEYAQSAADYKVS